jgi:hypothetical protein
MAPNPQPNNSRQLRITEYQRFGPCSRNTPARVSTPPDYSVSAPLRSHGFYAEHEPKPWLRGVICTKKGHWRRIAESRFRLHAASIERHRGKRLAPASRSIRTRLLFLAMILDMRLSCVLRVLGGMNCMGPRQVGVMRRFFVMTRFVMFRRFTVMPRSMCVMFR